MEPRHPQRQELRTILESDDLPLEKAKKLAALTERLIDEPRKLFQDKLRHPEDLLPNIFPEVMSLAPLQLMYITLAIFLNDTDNISFILQQEQLSIRMKLANAALPFALQINYVEAVKTLLDAKADIESEYYYYDIYKVTPLMLAASYKGGYPRFADDKEEKCDATVRLLIKEKANLEARCSQGDTPISYAERVPIIEALIESGANLEARNLYGGTPLFSATRLFLFPCHMGVYTDHSVSEARAILRNQSILKADVARRLLRARANIEAKDEKDKTPLSRAAMGGYVESVRLLLEHGACLPYVNFDRDLINSISQDDQFLKQDRDLLFYYDYDRLFNLTETIYLLLSYNTNIQDQDLEVATQVLDKVEEALKYEDNIFSQEILPQIYFCRGVLHEKVGDKRQAESYYRKMIESAPIRASTPAYRYLGGLYKESKPKYALEQYSIALLRGDILALGNIVALKQVLQVTQDSTAHQALLNKCDKLIYTHLLRGSDIRSSWLTSEQWQFLALFILSNPVFRSLDTSDDLGNSSIQALNVVRLAMWTARNAKMHAKAEHEKKKINSTLTFTLNLYKSMADPDYSKQYLATEVGDTILEFCDEPTLRELTSHSKDADSQGVEEEKESSSSLSNSASQLPGQTSTKGLFELLLDASRRKSVSQVKNKSSRASAKFDLAKPLVSKPFPNEIKGGDVTAVRQPIEGVLSKASTQVLGAHNSRIKYYTSLVQHSWKSVAVNHVSKSSDASSLSSSQERQKKR